MNFHWLGSHAWWEIWRKTNSLEDSHTPVISAAQASITKMVKQPTFRRRDDREKMQYRHTSQCYSTTTCDEITPFPAVVTENIWSWSRGDRRELAWREISAPCPELNQGALDEKQACHARDRQWPECRSKVTFGRSLVWTQEYFKEARGVNTYRSPLLST